MAFGTVVHHFAVGIRSIGVVGTSTTIARRTIAIEVRGSIVSASNPFRPHFLVVGFDGSRTGHLAQAPMKALIRAAARCHVIQWVVLCRVRH